MGMSFNYPMREVLNRKYMWITLYRWAHYEAATIFFQIGSSLGPYSVKMRPPFSGTKPYGRSGFQTIAEARDWVYEEYNKWLTQLPQGQSISLCRPGDSWYNGPTEAETLKYQEELTAAIPELEAASWREVNLIKETIAAI